MKYIELNNGVQMPQVGFGTYRIDNKILPRVLNEAYQLGYRQFDTAWKYGNESVIADWLRDYNVKREDVLLRQRLIWTLSIFGVIIMVLID